MDIKRLQVTSRYGGCGLTIKDEMDLQSDGHPHIYSGLDDLSELAVFATIYPLSLERGVLLQIIDEARLSRIITRCLKGNPARKTHDQPSTTRIAGPLRSFNGCSTVLIMERLCSRR